MVAEITITPQLRVDTVLKQLLSDDTSQTEAALTAVRSQKLLREETDRLKKEKLALTEEIQKLAIERDELACEMMTLRKKSSYYAKGVYGIFTKIVGNKVRHSKKASFNKADHQFYHNDLLEQEYYADDEKDCNDYRR